MDEIEFAHTVDPRTVGERRPIAGVPDAASGQVGNPTYGLA
jgi:hypothetical protein